MEYEVLLVILRMIVFVCLFDVYVIDINML